MARHLVAKGYSVSGYDPHEPARRAAAAHGVAVRESARDVAAASELVIIVVGFDHEVETVMYGPQGVMEAARPDLIVAIGSTVAPHYAKRLAQRAGERGVVVLDAPLARGEAAALAGKLLVFGGGDEATFAACRPAFGAFATDIFHLGAAGAGQVGHAPAPTTKGCAWAKRLAWERTSCAKRCTTRARKTGRWTSAATARACRGRRRT